MEQSPLTQQPRPEAFQPKIVQLYNAVLGVRRSVLSPSLCLRCMCKCVMHLKR